MRAFLASWGLVLAIWAVVVTIWGLMWWSRRREAQHFAKQRAEDERRWELRQQLWDMEQAIRDEQLSAEEREWRRQARERQAAIKREARRRLGLPEEDEAP